MLDRQSREQQLTNEGSPYALTEDLIEGIPCMIYQHAPKSLNDLYRNAQLMGAAALLVSGGRSTSYHDVFSKAATLGIALRDKFAVKPGTRVAIAVTEPSAWISTVIAVTSIGATAVLIAADMDTTRACYCIRVSRCSLVVTDGGEAIWKSECARVVTLEDVEMRTASPAMMRWETLPSRYEALIAFTSGTTGQPKGVILTHTAIVTGLMNMRLGAILSSPPNQAGSGRRPIVRTQAPCSLVMSPLYYIGGYSQLLLMLMIGGKVVLTSTPDTGELASLIEEESVKSIAGISEPQLRELMALKTNAGSLVFVGIHGVALHEDLLGEVCARWPSVSIGSGYGMTETAGSIAVITGAELKARPRSSGKVLPSVQIKITSDYGQRRAIGQVGKIWVRGAFLFRGYCTEAGDKLLLNDGWFDTGDLGVLGPDQHLYVHGRADQAFELSGRLVLHRDIERALLLSNLVSESVVLGLRIKDGRRAVAVAAVGLSSPPRALRRFAKRSTQI